MAQSNGGVSQTARTVLMPMLNPLNGSCSLWAFDPLSGFNDLVNPSIHNYKVEEVLTGRVPTVRRLIVTYRDLGVCTPIFMLTGTLNGQVVSNTTIPNAYIFGTQKATNKLFTQLIDLTLTAQNLQCTVIRPAGAGPLSIVTLKLVGQLEDQTL